MLSNRGGESVPGGCFSKESPPSLVRVIGSESQLDNLFTWLVFICFFSARCNDIKTNFRSDNNHE
ncbi:hypothetical protein CR203_14875 [Salipaludibacillus neizhouensis]|uniref:Uncharacterized protein n=1 Tax=Salipaludibacillus neizhouensis TaxID=885475 RepID=A0A3A9K5C5_9BACI|nr:hypothetical protein CR203_14875 [Salipaludibacillus neizhouensis]